jgi:hypothetical protein
MGGTLDPMISRPNVPVTMWIALVLTVAMIMPSGAVLAGPKGSGKVDPALTALYQEHAAYVAKGAGVAPFTSSNPLLRIVDERVVIDAVAETDPSALASELSALGMLHVSVFGRVVSGLFPIASITALDGVTHLRFARPAISRRRVGAVTSQGDQAIHADVARTTFGLSGAGIKVGVLSDSFNCLGGAPADVASGDLPLVQVLQEDPLCAFGTDEGRAMLQIVHDVAPGAFLAFATAEGGEANFANNILALAASGARVIVDDIGYPTELMFQDGISAQAVGTVVGQGVAYFSAAGNDARQSYESVFRPGAVFMDGQIPAPNPFLHFFGGTAHNFAPSGPPDVFQRITIPQGGQLFIIFQWDSPGASACIGCPGSPNDLDIYLLNAAASQVVAASATDNLGGDPVEVLSFVNFGPTADFNLMIVNFTGPSPGFVKYINDTNGALTGIVQEFNTASGTVFGHPNAIGAEAVGAAAWYNTPAFGVSPPLLEPFSSSGPTSVLFDTAGNRFPSPVVRQKPGVVGPDGVNNTFFGVDIPQDPDTFPNFFGTSAAAPHAAAAAALLLQLQPILPPVSIYSALRSTAIDMGAPGVDFDTGYGLIQANAAAALVSTLQGEAAAILPASRSVQVGATATAFATVINGGPGQAVGVGLSLATPLLGTFSYQMTNPATNQPIGSPNTPVNIPAGGFQTFVVSITPSALLAPTDVKFFFSGANTFPTPALTGIDTLLLSASLNPVPDLIALAATPSGDLITTIPGNSGMSAFAVAAANVGVTGSITVSADTGAANLPLAISVCETDINAACIPGLGPGASVTTTITAGATPTFSIFVTALGAPVPFNPAANRIFVRFKDAGNVTRGSTSVAVRTQ